MSDQMLLKLLVSKLNGVDVFHDDADRLLDLDEWAGVEQGNELTVVAIHWGYISHELSDWYPGLKRTLFFRGLEVSIFGGYPHH